MDKLSELYQTSVNRRKFLGGIGAVGAASVLAGCGNTSNITTSSTTYTDVDILNFALNLEYLEAEFYLNAATGSGLATADIGSSPGTVTVSGSTKVTGLSTAQQNILNEIAFDEQAHVRFLRSAIAAAGGMPVARPAIDLTFFGPLATVAKIPIAFNPLGANGFDAFVVGAFIFEDVGVTAYAGAAPLISTAGIAAGYLSAAAGIMAVEAYHAAYIRTYLTSQAIATPSYAFLGYANQVSTLRATLGGGNETALTVPTGTVPVTATTIVSPSSIVAATSANAIAYARNTDQVLHIVYGSLSNTAGATTSAAGVAKGGFFPNGLNGNITVTQS